MSPSSVPHRTGVSLSLSHMVLLLVVLQLLLCGSASPSPATPSPNTHCEVAPGIFIPATTTVHESRSVGAIFVETCPTLSRSSDLHFESRCSHQSSVTQFIGSQCNPLSPEASALTYDAVTKTASYSVDGGSPGAVQSVQVNIQCSTTLNARIFSVYEDAKSPGFWKVHILSSCINVAANRAAANSTCKFHNPFEGYSVDLSPIDVVVAFQTRVASSPDLLTFQQKLCGPVPMNLMMVSCASSHREQEASFWQVSGNRCFSLARQSSSLPAFDWDENGNLYLFYEGGDPQSNGELRHVAVEVVCDHQVEYLWSFQGENEQGQYSFRVLTKHVCRQP